MCKAAESDWDPVLSSDEEVQLDNKRLETVLPKHEGINYYINRKNIGPVQAANYRRRAVKQRPPPGSESPEKPRKLLKVLTVRDASIHHRTQVRSNASRPPKGARGGKNTLGAKSSVQKRVAQQDPAQTTGNANNPAARTREELNMRQKTILMALENTDDDDG